MTADISEELPVEVPLLQHYSGIRSSSPDEARHLFHSAYGLQDLVAIGDRQEFFAQTNHKPLKDISLTYCAFGGTVELEFPEANLARQLFCLSGNGVAQAGKTPPRLQIDSSLPVPLGQPAKLRYADGFRQIVLRIGGAALVDKVTALLGNEPGAPIRLEWGQTGGYEKTALRDLVMYLAQAIHPLEMFGAQSPLIAELEQAIITTFLFANRSNYSELLRARPKDAAPWQVRAVEDYIASHWNQPIDMLQLVKITGASARSIYQVFARTRGYSPKAFLKQTRLTQARTRLQSSDPGISVTAIALSCGFHNLGHFARDYRELFGELPSETLARQRPMHSLRATG